MAIGTHPIFVMMQREGMDLPTVSTAGNGRRALTVPLVSWAPRLAHGQDRAPKAGEGKLLTWGNNFNLYLFYFLGK